MPHAPVDTTEPSNEGPMLILGDLLLQGVSRVLLFWVTNFLYKLVTMTSSRNPRVDVSS